jgi:hypothetical protein
MQRVLIPLSTRKKTAMRKSHMEKDKHVSAWI